MTKDHLMQRNVKERVTVSSLEINEVAGKLRKDIFSGFRMPGERLIESDLMATYSASQRTIRYVLSLLEQEDLVIIKPYKGASVARISSIKISENYHVISVLEGYSARLAAERMSKEDIKKMSAIVKAQDKLGPKDAKEWMNLNAQFHRIINLNSGNCRLMEIIRQNVRFMSYWFLILSAPGRMSMCSREHELIVTALKKRDPEMSSKLMERHIIDAAQYLIDSLRDTLPKGVLDK